MNDQDRDTSGNSTAPTKETSGRFIGAEDMKFWQTVTEDVKENAHCAVAILNDLLNYDKIESRTLNLEISMVPIWDLLNQTVKQFRVQAMNHKVDLNLSLLPQQEERHTECHDLEAGALENVFREKRLYVIGDDIRLRQVLRNLISNALKFTPSDGIIKVIVSYNTTGLNHSKPVTSGGSDVPHPLSEEQPRSGSIIIRVQDSGVGLSPNQLGRLFGEGVQFDANKLQHGGGSGLGLGKLTP